MKNMKAFEKNSWVNKGVSLFTSLALVMAVTMPSPAYAAESSDAETEVNAPAMVVAENTPAEGAEAIVVEEAAEGAIVAEPAKQEDPAAVIEESPVVEAEPIEDQAEKTEAAQVEKPKVEEPKAKAATAETEKADESQEAKTAPVAEAAKATNATTTVKAAPKAALASENVPAAEDAQANAKAQAVDATPAAELAAKTKAATPKATATLGQFQVQGDEGSYAYENNVLTVIFGRLFPMPQVGNYSQAFKWDTMAHSLITNTVGQLAQPVLVESSDNQLRVYRKMIRFTAFLSMPLMFGLALVSREFILITIGSAWLGCVPLLQLLCLSGAFMPLHTMYQNLAISNGRSDIFMWLNILQIILQVTLIILIAPYGMYLMVAAYSLFIFLWLLPWHLFTGRLIAYSWWEAFKDVAPFVLLSLAVMLLTWFITQPILNIWLLLLAKVLIATLLYYAIMKLLHVQILRECEAFFKSQLHR